MSMSTPPPVPPDDQPPIPPVPIAPPPASQTPWPQSQAVPPAVYAPPAYDDNRPIVPPKSTMGTGTKVFLFGCLGLVLLVAVGAGLGGKWIWGKLKPIMENPEQFIAEQLIATHTDLELLTVDKSTHSFTLRHKPSGETLTARIEDFKDGRVILTKSDGTKVELGPAGLKAVSPDGAETSIGVEAVPLPDWVPDYPGDHTVLISSRQNQDGSLQGVYVFSTPDEVAAAKASYQKALTDAGYGKQETADASGAGFQSATVKASTAAAEGQIRTITLQISAAEGKTQVNLNYNQSPQEK